MTKKNDRIATGAQVIGGEALARVAGGGQADEPVDTIDQGVAVGWGVHGAVAVGWGLQLDHAVAGGWR